VKILYGKVQSIFRPRLIGSDAILPELTRLLIVREDGSIDVLESRQASIHQHVRRRRQDLRPPPPAVAGIGAIALASRLIGPIDCVGLDRFASSRATAAVHSDLRCLLTASVESDPPPSPATVQAPDLSWRPWEIGPRPMEIQRHQRRCDTESCGYRMRLKHFRTTKSRRHEGSCCPKLPPVVSSWFQFFWSVFAYAVLPAASSRSGKRQNEFLADIAG
jgi:hypothetical protein